jgi:hypothetical protein
LAHEERVFLTSHHNLRVSRPRHTLAVICIALIQTNYILCIAQAETNKTPTTAIPTEKRKTGRPKNPNTQKINEGAESFRNYVRRFRNSPITREGYVDWIRRFLQYCNECNKGIEVGDNPDLLLFDGNTKKIQSIIKNYIDHQYEVKHLSPKSVRSYFLAIKHFYESRSR